MGTTCGQWLKMRLPSYSLGEIDINEYLQEYDLEESTPYDLRVKEKIFAVYANILKKLILTFSDLTQEGASVKIPIDFLQSELDIYKKYLPFDECDDGIDIINAGEWR